ncbi:MAG: hypothetical protein ACKOC1_04480 [Hyphomicrobiales bacterium]
MKRNIRATRHRLLGIHLDNTISARAMRIDLARDVLQTFPDDTLFAQPFDNLSTVV